MIHCTETQMHEDHLKWTGDRAMWRDDLRAWEEETTQAMADIQRLQTALAEHEQALETHAAAIRAYEQGESRRAHAWVESKLESNDEARQGLANAHAGDRQHHQKLLATHEAIKHRHREALAHLRNLLKAACQLAPKLQLD